MEYYFTEDYKNGKQSEKDSQPDLQEIFNDNNLILDEDVFANFDFYSDVRCVELKTRFNTKLADGKLLHIKRDGELIELDSLMFDTIKMQSAGKYNRAHPPKEFFIVWKLQDNIYGYWKIDTSKKNIEYTRQDVSGNMGFGCIQRRDTITVLKEFITFVTIDKNNGSVIFL